MTTEMHLLQTLEWRELSEKGNLPILSVELRNIWPQKFLLEEGMINWRIGGL